MAATNPALRIEQGQDFSLRTGEFAQTSDGAYRIGFDGVTADSRCPKGEQCIRAGDASVRIWVQQGGGPKETRELNTAAETTQSVRVLERVVRLVRLEPAQVTGRTIAKSDYVATLRLGRNSAGESDR